MRRMISSIYHEIIDKTFAFRMTDIEMKIFKLTGDLSTFTRAAMLIKRA